MQDAGCRMQDAGCAGCGMQDAGCGMGDAKKKLFPAREQLFLTRNGSVLFFSQRYNRHVRAVLALSLKLHQAVGEGK